MISLHKFLIIAINCLFWGMVIAAIYYHEIMWVFNFIAGYLMGCIASFLVHNEKQLKNQITRKINHERA